jgi:hypothetical protein
MTSCPRARGLQALSVLQNAGIPAMTADADLFDRYYHRFLETSDSEELHDIEQPAEVGALGRSFLRAVAHGGGKSSAQSTRSTKTGL